jgi:hypothetical protein
MNTATEVIAKVQIVRVLALMGSSFGPYACEWSLTSISKKEL